MEKEEKGLFGRLLDFWREKIIMEDADGIGFRNEKEGFESYFAEMGTMDVLTQEEVKKTFWEEKAEWNEKEERAEVFREEIFDKKAEPLEEDEEESLKKEKRQAEFFMAEVFRTEAAEEQMKQETGKMFFADIPEKEEERTIIPVAEETKEKDFLTEQEFSEKERIVEKRTEKMTEPTIDIESLMRQMTRKLWEEREGSGRRLR